MVSLLSSVPTSVVSYCIGSFLTSIDAHHFAHTSQRSLQQLQRYEFQHDAPVCRVHVLNTPHLRPSTAFGLIRHVRIASTDEFVNLHRLPASVTRVTILIRQPFPRKFVEFPLAADHSLPLIVLPATVVELRVESEYRCDLRLIAPWLHRFLLHPDSRLQSLSIHPDAEILPPLVHQLPDSVTNLELPERCNMQAQLNVARWPPNLTRLRCSPLAPLANLLKLSAATITELDAYNFRPHLRTALINQLPRFRAIDGCGFYPLEKGCSFPLNLTSLKLSHIVNIPWFEGVTFPPFLISLSFPHYSHGFPPNFSFPSTLTELRLPYYGNHELSLPESLTTLEIGASVSLLDCESNSAAHVIPFARIRWPASLHTLILGNNVSSLRGWTPPPNLTHLHTGDSWNLTLDHLPLPDTLLILTLDWACDQSLIGVRFPAQLQDLRFTYKPRYPFTLTQAEWFPPPSLTALDIYHCAKNLYLPPTLQRFTMRGYVRSEVRVALPAGLLELDLSTLAQRIWFKSDALIQALPPNLRCLRLSTDSFIEYDRTCLPRADQFPQSLQECWLTGRSKMGYCISPVEIQRWLTDALPKGCSFIVKLETRCD